ncbi:hypothetical protein BT96DRAFT_942244 [Gymnopus androsaceus JB14]|uniref:DUF7223 domain-containing protein n=1 Tax=Gymnopus androsaceus JB14 TaxID=1447944 RepID=A0A6A4HBN4_9AGAR|nr:hypothetical protein BT96DRAFT_942244 [Gymnopus androsaceus JB14]
MAFRSLAQSKLACTILLIGIAGQITPSFAANDWTTPCFDGVCQYSLTAAPGQNGSGTMQIWGSANALSDITTAAGWQILNCSSTEMAQDIRLVCNSSDTQGAGCDHLFQAGGAVGKVVRLPEDCGMSPFARVVNASVSQDQTIPAGMNTTAQVQALSLDVDFGAIDPSKAGNLSIAIQGANVPGADVNGTLVSTTASRRRSRIEGRSGMTMERSLSSFVGNAIDSIKSLNTFNINKTDDLPPVNVDKSATIFNKSISCGDVELSADVSVDGQANAQASIGVAAQGTIVPPELTDFQVIVGLNADVDGTVDLNAGVEASFSTGPIEIFTIGIPGLDFPGILSIGPTFDVNVEADAVLDLAADLQVGLVYNVSNAQLVFPPSGNAQSGGDFNFGDTPLSLSLSPSVTATGNFTAHLIPSLNLGVSALDGAASASIFLNLDASATLVLELQATDDASTTVDSITRTQTPRRTLFQLVVVLLPVLFILLIRSLRQLLQQLLQAKLLDTAFGLPQAHVRRAGCFVCETSCGVFFCTCGSLFFRIASGYASSSSSAYTYATSNSSSNSTSSSDNSSNSTTSSSNSTSSSSSGLQFGGCVEIDVGLAVNAGAEGKLFDIFDDSTTVPLFNKEFVLFQKCFGDANVSSLAAAELAVPPADDSSSSDVLTCLASNLGAPASVVEGATIAGKVIDAAEAA